jgi:glutathione peroxidase
MSIFDLLSLRQVPKVTSSVPSSSIYDLSIGSLDGKTINLSDFKGKKILFVNVASRCGFTKQYKGLQRLFEQERERLIVIGIPCNQFGRQESGSSKVIQNFCSRNFGVSFPISEKIKVKGTNQHPIYNWLTNKLLNGAVDSKVKWNFQKYLINEEGALQSIFSSKIDPLSKEVIDAIKK